MTRSTVARAASPMGEAGHIPAVILAGGQSRRMGGGDKCLLELDGQCMLDRVIARIAPQAGPLVLNANGDPARFARFDLPVVPDSVAGFAGPLAGVLAGMDWAAGQGADHIVSVASDTPFFPRDLVRKLDTGRADAPIALAAIKDPERGIRRHPTFGLWSVALRDDLRAALEDGLRKVVIWTDKHSARDVVFDAEQADPFFNINTPEDLEKALVIGASE